MTKSSTDALFERVKALRAEGHQSDAAWRLAYLESLLDAWPAGWGEYFCPLVFGDFEPPESEFGSEPLGVWIEPTPLKGTVIRSARTVLRARVRVAERTVGGLKDAVTRLQLMLGVLSWTHYGSPIHWWSYMTAPSIGGVTRKLEPGNSARIAELLALLPVKQSRRFRAALFWMRHQSALMHEGYRDHTFAQFAGYWNALELLVALAHDLQPPTAATDTERDDQVADYMSAVQGPIKAQHVRTMHRTIIDPGLQQRLRHALNVFVSESEDEYWNECFDTALGEWRLYRIRNGIAHGGLDIDDPEVARSIENRLGRLSIIVLSMFQGALRIAFQQYASTAVASTKGAL